MKKFAVFISLLLICATLVSCANGNGGKNHQITADGKETIQNPEESTQNVEIELPRLTARVGDSQRELECYYCYTLGATSDKFGSLGNETASMLSVIAETVTHFSYSESISLTPEAGGELSYVRVYDAEFQKTLEISDEDLTPLGTLEDGQFYLIVGVSKPSTYIDITAEWTFEYVFSMTVSDSDLLVESGDETIAPIACWGYTYIYDAESDTWLCGDGSGAYGQFSEDANAIPRISLEEDISYRFLVTDGLAEESIGVSVYNASFESVPVNVVTLSDLWYALESGTYYVVITATRYGGDYIASADMYVSTVQMEYLFALTVN